MKRLLIIAGLLLPCAASLADEPDRAALSAMGAVLKESNGVITGLQVECTNLTDDDYRRIGEIKSLKSLSISGKAMLDKHLELLTGLTEVEAIMINGSQLSDEGYRHFTAFKNLRSLSLFHPSRNSDTFTGAGLAHLEKLPSLERLTFAGATAGDEAYAAIGKLTQLHEFREWHNWETAAGKRQLLALSNLKSLKIGQRLPRRGQPPTPSFDNATLATIAQMTSLERLDLQEARLDFEGLSQLRALPNLKQLRLSVVDISEADVNKLQKAMRGVTILWEPLTEAGAETLAKKLKL